MKEKLEHQNVRLQLQIVNVDNQCDQAKENHQHCRSQRLNFVSSNPTFDFGPRKHSINDEDALLEIEGLLGETQRVPFHLEEQKFDNDEHN